MTREEAIEKSNAIYQIEDPDVIRLCIKRLGITEEYFNDILTLPKKTFRDYPNHFTLIKWAKPIIFILSKLHILPGSVYIKYFKSGY
jgi:hypothetical protein